MPLPEDLAQSHFPLPMISMVSRLLSPYSVSSMCQPGHFRFRIVIPVGNNCFDDDGDDGDDDEMSLHSRL